ncbi:hypothetical protein KTQ74_21965 [Pseudomonas chlororaphis]|uniref:hypothetical protein n=1 Tax=Pseudomonas chlororaphis TaxID=587753 RepID=UPI001E606B8E|nr:hypothetical protein [Pseudomonas chlororaphis]MCB2254587.1 hypothetical protein [Pseudomonas chlororaphis]
MRAIFCCYRVGHLNGLHPQTKDEAPYLPPDAARTFELPGWHPCVLKDMRATLQSWINDTDMARHLGHISMNQIPLSFFEKQKPILNFHFQHTNSQSQIKSHKTLSQGTNTKKPKKKVHLPIKKP